jgi:tetratricopeptide (TPR) repeat protein
MRATTLMTSMLATVGLLCCATLALAQSNAPAVPSKTNATNAECRDLMLVRGQNNASLEYARKWWAVQQNAESATCMAMTLTAMGEIREADSVIKAFEPDKLDAATQGDYFWARSYIADSLGRTNAAFELAKKSRAAYSKDEKAKDFAAEVNVTLSGILIALDREEEAQTHLEIAEKLCRATWCKASAIASRASMASDGGEARKLYASASSLYESINDIAGMLLMSVATAKSFITDEQYAEAEKMLTRARSLQQQVGSRGTEADLLLARADLLRAQGKPRQARERYEQAISLAREIGMNAIAKDALTNLNELE